MYASEPPPSRSRQPQGTAASIWAPQPQPSESTWPQTLDSFSRVAEREFYSSGCGDQARYPVVRREDVFGPVPPPRDIGAIGDGRKKNSPEFHEGRIAIDDGWKTTSAAFDDGRFGDGWKQNNSELVLGNGDGRKKSNQEFDNTHVEQLLRTLNLNSPAPYTKKPALSLDTSPSSPDFSPASATSSLLTPTDLSPSRPGFDPKMLSPYELGQGHPYAPQNSLLFENASPISHPYRPQYPPSVTTAFPFFEPFSEPPTPAPPIAPHYQYNAPPVRRMDNGRPFPPMDWRLAPQPQPSSSEWPLPEDKLEYNSGAVGLDEPPRSPFVFQHPSIPQGPSHEPINFLSLLHPSSSPPYHIFVARIIKSSDQQASIFLQQKLKVADLEERAKIVDAICARGFEMMAHRFGNWAVQRCLEAASTPEERRKIVMCMRGRIVELATNCYGCHVLQKALDCEEDIRLLIVSELLLGDPAQTLVNKHASHVWSKIMELSWTPPAPPIFAYVNKSLKGKWASLACHETGSLVVQHAFENLEAEAKDGIVDELLNHGPAVFGEVAKNQWGSYCVQHILEHGSEKHRQMALQHLLDGLLEFATNEQGSKSVTKALKEGGKETLDKVIDRMCEPAKGSRRAMIVDLALSVTGSQLIASVLPTADKDQRALLYECIRGHIVTLRGCKTGSKVIWLFDRMRAYYGY
ncbi:armadillo-type protein [Collybia nuda]|uniref:Armadillo-type protein n=1 Tax=Collybia nuda TaxID=64659 RepID=A0A9P6CIJ5_9AGAR|nr:armadillo-type protein [Collybia nuda]